MQCLVTKKAPDFTAKAVMGDNTINENFNLKEYLNGKIAVLFFYPADFSFVCPSEIIAYNNRVEDFRKEGAEVIGVSTDSHFVHLAWKEMPVEKGGIGTIKFPLVADISKQISWDYGVLCSEEQMSMRGTFIIDQDGKVVSQFVNDFNLGRNVDETLRLIEALKFTQESGGLCPVNWKKGDKGIEATTESISGFLAENSEKL